MYKNNQLWNRYFPRSQRISYRYRETPQYLNIYVIDLSKFLLLFLLTIIKQKYFSSLPKFLFNYFVFESILLLVVWPRYSENYIVMISCTWEEASKQLFGQPVNSNIICLPTRFCWLQEGENTILVLTFWSHSQFSPYILVAVNLVPIIFSLYPIWFLSLTH